MKRFIFMLILGLLCRAPGGSAFVAAAEPSTASVDRPAADASRQPDWIRVGKSRYGWDWLAARCDKNADGAVDRSEFPLSGDVFARMDRTWDGKLTSHDFDWSKDGSLCRQKEATFALFKPVDKNSDGRITADEWQALFEQAAKQKGYLNEEQLEQLIYLPRAEKTARENKLRTGRSEFSPERMKNRTDAPQPGDMAPDFELRSPDGKQTVRLSSFRGKQPVVLVFGCFTCGNYRTYSESMEELHQLWKDDAAFLRVYVREAHPVADDRPATSTNAEAGILIKQPATFAERCEVATNFASTLHVKTPLVVDEIDNHVGQAYGAWPDRLYVIDREGRIAFAGGPGPFGFNPREMEQSLAMLLLEEEQSEK